MTDKAVALRGAQIANVGYRAIRAPSTDKVCPAQCAAGTHYSPLATTNARTHTQWTLVTRNLVGRLRSVSRSVGGHSLVGTAEPPPISSNSNSDRLIAALKKLDWSSGRFPLLRPLHRQRIYPSI